ncbi:uncharacterized protein LOC143942237 [Lithobates pipiens]
MLHPPRMPRLKTTRIRRKKTKVLPQRLAAKRKKTPLQPPTDFEDVAVYFSEEEWRYLEADQMDLYRQVMIDNYQTIQSLGYQHEKPSLISKIEQDEDLFITGLEKHSQGTPKFKTEEPHTSLLTSEKMRVIDIHLTGDLKNGTKYSTNENGSLPPRRQYNFRDRAAVEYTVFYEDAVRERKPHQCLQRFKTKGVNTPKQLKVEEIHFTGDLKNSATTSSNENWSVHSKRQHKCRDKAAVQCTSSYEDKMRDLKPRKRLQRKSSCDKIVDVPSVITEELHTSFLKPEILTGEKRNFTGNLANSTKQYPDNNEDLLSKRQYNFRDRAAVEYTAFYEDDVRERKPHKNLQRKSGYDKIVSAPKFKTKLVNTPLLTPKKLKVEEINFIGDLKNHTKTSDKNGGLPPKRQYNFRDRGAVEYTGFYDDEVRELKPHKSLHRGSSYDDIQPKCGRYRCSECGKSFSQKPTLVKHQMIHTGISIFVCSKCDKCFTQRCNLKRHERSHAVQRPCVCSYCGKGFTESSSLLKHQRIHTGFKPFACSECGRTFSISTYLIVHQRTHTGEKPYVCGDCGKSFTQSSHLITHQRIHTGIKPYACIECGKGFTTSSHLITHQRTHTGERPYQCGECGMAFKHSTHLVLHKRKHTGERPYSCPKCPRTFSQRPQLLKHQRKLHAYDRKPPSNLILRDWAEPNGEAEALVPVQFCSLVIDSRHDLLFGPELDTILDRTADRKNALPLNKSFYCDRELPPFKDLEGFPVVQWMESRSLRCCPETSGEQVTVLPDDLRRILQALPTRADFEALPSKADIELLIARVEEAHARDIQEVRGDIQALSVRVDSGATSLQSLTQRVLELERTGTVQQAAITDLCLHTEDLEDCSRRNNLRLRGIPEATGSEDLEATVVAIFHKILAVTPAPMVELDRVHRTLGPKPTDPERPRDVLCRVHRYSQKEMILRRAWEHGEVNFDGAVVKVLPDLSRATLQRRALLRLALELSRRRGCTYRWGYPLAVTFRRENGFFTLRTPEDLPAFFLFLGVDPIPVPNWGSSIEPTTWSDHAPILISYSLTDGRTAKVGTWRLNESLLQDAEVLQEVVRGLEQFFALNDTPDISPGIVWEAHKAVIRGVLIKHGARIKRRRNARLTALLQDLHRAEARHKHAQSPASEADLKLLRVQITDLMQFRAKASLQKCKRISYEASNKCGKILAQKLREQAIASYVPQVMTPHNQKVTLPREIAGEFQKFYGSLYNLQTPTLSHAHIENYLSAADMPKLSEEVCMSLEEPISMQELQAAVGATKVGKAPGPDGFTAQYYKMLLPSLGGCDWLRRGLHRAFPVRHFRYTLDWESCLCGALPSDPRKQIRRFLAALRMPRLKTSRVKRKKTKVLRQRLATKRKKTHLQAPTDFEDVAVYFSEEEWRYLEADQIDLYRQVMIENYETIHSLGYQNEKPALISKIERGQDLFIKELENHSQDAASFNTEELHTSPLTPEKLTVQDMHLKGDLGNSTKPSSNEKGSLLARRQYNFRNRVAMEYNMFYDDVKEVRELKPPKCLQRKSRYDKIVYDPKFKSEELHTSLSTLKDSILEELCFKGELENGTKTSSKENGSLSPKCQYNFRDRLAVEYNMFLDDEEKVRKLKPHTSLQKKPSYSKIIHAPSSNIEELHTSLKPNVLPGQEIQISADPENSTETLSSGNGSFSMKRQYNFRDRLSLEYSDKDQVRELKSPKRLRKKSSYGKIQQCTSSYEDEVRGLKPHKSLQRKSSCEKIVDVPSVITEELHTSFLTPEILTGGKVHITGDLENNTKTSSDKNVNLPPKRQYNFRDRGAVEYTGFYDDDEVRELKPHKSLQKGLSYGDIQPKCGRYRCSECGKSYSQKPTLVKHQMIHTGISIYVCSKCDKCFTQRCNLKRHERSHFVERPCVCSYCGKGFTESSSLLKHQRIHTGLKPFACSECGKTFSISTYLIVHQRTHTGEKPYVCGDCGKSFTQSSSLITHQRTHTGIKPYGCIECGKGFSTSSHLITHQRTHTGERPYLCGECGMAFKHSTHLVLHKRKHTGERPYRCAKCPRAFSQRPQLLKHQRKLHAYE